jgi:helicase
MSTSRRIYYEDVIGAAIRGGTSRLSERTELAEPLRKALVAYYGQDILISPPQDAALTAGIAVRNGHDFLITAPTNSGKTLISLFRLFTAAMIGERRCVYVAPLKALAEEKAAEFRAIAECLSAQGCRRIKVSVTTGDYQLTRDFLGSPPPEQGEIVICTPERLEVMLRNPENHGWARAVDTFAFDEFHLLGDRTRGGVMETLTTRILASCGWPSLIFLSATIGNPETIIDWLTHTGRKVKHLHSDYRFPKLCRRLMVCRDLDETVDELIREIVASPERSALVFTATRPEANAQAIRWQKQHPKHRFAAVHAGLPSVERNRLLCEIRQGRIKAVAATTTLKMGVNFPVTDVVIRDAKLGGKAGTYPLSSSDVAQMMGRAGRGEVKGTGILLLTNEEDAPGRKAQMESGELEPIHPRLVPRKLRRAKMTGAPEGFTIRPLNGVVLTQCVVQKRVSLPEVRDFVGHTFSAFSGLVDAGEVPKSVDFLLRNHLIEPVEGMDGAFQARPLGQTVALCGISPEAGSVLAGMLRALIKLQKKQTDDGTRSEDLIERLTALDFLFLAVGAHECRDHWLRKTDEPALLEVQNYVEALPVEEKPLFNRWRDPADPVNPTRRLLTTLRVEGNLADPEECALAFNRIMATAILLHRHAKGTSMGTLSMNYSHGKRQLYEGALESGLKYTVVWALSCLSQICDPEKAYNMEHVKMRILELIEDVSIGSELGKLTAIEGVGVRSVQKLIEHGINDVEALRGVPAKDFADLGLSKTQSEAIGRWVRQRNR